MRKPILHEMPASHMAPAEEFHFPLTLEDLGPLASKLPDWFSRFLGSELIGIRAVLEKDWSHLKGPEARQLADFLLAANRFSLFHWTEYGERFWLAISDPSWKGEVMFREPQILDEADESYLASFQCPELADFCRHFHDSHMDMDPTQTGLHFRTPLLDWASFSELGWPGHEDQEAGVNIYYSSCGDAFFLTKSGKVERRFHSGPIKFEVVAESFNEFIGKYIEHLQTGAWGELFW